MGITILAASVDPLEKTTEVQGTLSFPIAYGVTRDQAAAIDAWWEDRRSIIQPSEFVLDGGGKVLSATYSTGPVGRRDAGDAPRRVKFPGKNTASGD